MFTISIELKPSKIHGIGVFASTFIPKDTLIWRYNEPPDKRIPLNENTNTYEAKHFGYIPFSKNYIEIPGDNAKYLNHSFEPNVVAPEGDDMFANRDIEAGEEITVNYFQFDSNPESDGKLI